MLFPLNAIGIVVCQQLAGHKHGLRFGDGPIHISPAMHELLSKAETPAELELLLNTMAFKQLPPLPGQHDGLPLRYIDPAAIPTPDLTRFVRAFVPGAHHGPVIADPRILAVPARLTDELGGDYGHGEGAEAGDEGGGPGGRAEEGEVGRDAGP